MTFCLRDAPSEFQRRTEYVAGAISRRLDIKFSEAYLDDFIQICTAEQYSDVLSIIAAFGHVMGVKKCAAPATEQEVLGLVINTRTMQLFALSEKVDVAASLLRDFARGKTTTTAELARILGILVSIEPAVPHLLLLARPLYDDLKDVLVSTSQFGPHDSIEVDRHGLMDSRPALEWKDVTFSPS